MSEVPRKLPKRSTLTQVTGKAEMAALIKSFAPAASAKAAKPAKVAA